MTRQIEGVIDIACRASEANRLLLAMAMEIASEIEEELFLHSSERERALLRSFLREAHPSVWSVISISGQFMMASAAAARLLDGTDQIVLWEQASQAAALQCERSVILTLADGRQIQARCKPVESHGRTVGVVIELDPDSLEQTELQQILAAVRQVDSNKLRAARDLRISRSTLYPKLRAYGIELDRTIF